MQRLQEAREETLKAIMLCTAMSGCITDLIDLNKCKDDCDPQEYLHKNARVLTRISSCTTALPDVLNKALSLIGDYGQDELKSFGL